MTSLARAFEIGAFQHRAELAAFVAFLKSRGPIHSVIEIGMLHGGTTALWCALASGRVFGIDKPEGAFGGRDHGLNASMCGRRNARLCAEFMNFSGFIGDSQDPEIVEEVLAQLNGGRVSLLFIDGDHAYEAVCADFARYREMVESGGVIAFHDIADTNLHRQRGVEVPRFWAELIGEKYEFLAPGESWGGIGAVIV